MRRVLAAWAAVFVAACASAPSQSDLLWAQEQCPIPSDDDGEIDYICHFQIPARAVIVLPVESRALDIWNRNGEAMYTRPLAGDVIAVIASDEAGGFTWQTRAELDGTGLSPRQLWRRALQNVDLFGASAELHRYPDGVFWVRSDSISAAALIFSRELWRRTEFRTFSGSPVILLQGRDHFLVADSEDTSAVASLRRWQTNWPQSSPTDYPDFVSRSGLLLVREKSGAWRVLE